MLQIGRLVLLQQARKQTFTPSGSESEPFLIRPMLAQF
jgi:hypothetical protein